MTEIEKRIEKLQLEIKAMQNDPFLKEGYVKKVLELMSLRRKQTRRKNEIRFK